METAEISVEMLLNRSEQARKKPDSLILLEEIS
jgi:hypothetical protein